MIRIERIINWRDPHYKYGELVLRESFPTNEYRDLTELRKYVNSNNLFHFNLILDDNTPIGIITYWLLDACCYVEHFAIEQSKRNSGYGEKVLSKLKQLVEERIVLEVEMPEDEITKRRIKFYERAGFTLYNKPYFQPPYRKEDKPLPMLIMAYGKEIINKEFIDIRNIIYKEVYHYTLES